MDAILPFRNLIHDATRREIDEVFVTCPPKIGPLKMRDSCKIRTGGSVIENKKVFGGAGIPYPQRG